MEKNKLFNIQDVQLIEENDWNNKLNKLLKDVAFENLASYLQDNEYIEYYDDVNVRKLNLDAICYKGLTEKIISYIKAEPINSFIVRYAGPISWALTADILLLEYKDRYIILCLAFED